MLSLRGKKKREGRIRPTNLATYKEKRKQIVQKGRHKLLRSSFG